MNHSMTGTIHTGASVVAAGFWKLGIAQARNIMHHETSQHHMYQIFSSQEHAVDRVNMSSMLAAQRFS